MSKHKKTGTNTKLILPSYDVTNSINSLKGSINKVRSKQKNMQVESRNVVIVDAKQITLRQSYQIF